MLNNLDLIINNIKNIFTYQTIDNTQNYNEISVKEHLDYQMCFSPFELKELFLKLNLIKKVNILASLSSKKSLEIGLLMKEKVFKEKEVIIKQGQMSNMLYIINKGSIVIKKNNVLVRKLDEGSCFGEVSLILKNPHTADVFVDSKKLIVYTISYEEFNIIVDETSATYKNLISYINNLDMFQNLQLNNLYISKVLGEGRYGNVVLAHNKINLYAVKIVKKEILKKNKVLINYFVNEKKILLTLNNNFIVKLVKTLQNDKYIFYVQEYVKGKEFSKYLNYRLENDIRNIYILKFYMAILIIAVDYLHCRNICHRDLKPQNIMIDDNGYLKLLDFGTSIVLDSNCKSKGITYTLTGTPHYIAPEVILGKGYNNMCDIWSLGIIAYEIYYNIFPFGENSSDPLEVYKEIIEEKLKFKEINIKSEDINYTSVDLVKDNNTNDIKNEFYKNKQINDDVFVKNFITKLLNKKPLKRIRGLEQFKKEDLFLKFDFVSLST